MKLSKQQQSQQQQSQRLLLPYGPYMGDALDIIIVRPVTTESSPLSVNKKDSSLHPVDNKEGDDNCNENTDLNGNNNECNNNECNNNIDDDKNNNNDHDTNCGTYACSDFVVRFPSSIKVPSISLSSSLHMDFPSPVSSSLSSSSSLPVLNKSPSSPLPSKSPLSSSYIPLSSSPAQSKHKKNNNSQKSLPKDTVWDRHANSSILQPSVAAPSPSPSPSINNPPILSKKKRIPKSKSFSFFKSSYSKKEIVNVDDDDVDIIEDDDIVDNDDINNNNDNDNNNDNEEGMFVVQLQINGRYVPESLACLSLFGARGTRQQQQQQQQQSQQQQRLKK